MATSPTQIRIDENTKQQAVELLEGLGLSLSDAVNMFLKQVILQNGIPCNNFSTIESNKEISKPRFLADFRLFLNLLERTSSYFIYLIPLKLPKNLYTSLYSDFCLTVLPPP